MKVNVVNVSCQSIAGVFSTRKITEQILIPRHYREHGDLPWNLAAYSSFESQECDDDMEEELKWRE